jgi:hypothetical protein
MYIHKKYSINNSITDVKKYKDALKEICKINLRRSSKFNILAILGALNCVKEAEFSNNTGLYVCSEYGSITSVKKVLEDVSNDSIIMPFDFLNINNNNVSFYVSQALNISGKNMLLTSHNLSFEKGLELAYFDLNIEEVDDVLIGAVDESLSSINNYNKYILNSDKLPSNDYSSWLYINKIKENSLCEIESISIFHSVEDLNNIIDSLDYDVVFLNQFAKQKVENIKVEKIKISQNEVLNTMEHIISFIDNTYLKMIMISMDRLSKGSVITFSK